MDGKDNADPKLVGYMSLNRINRLKKDDKKTSKQNVFVDMLNNKSFDFHGISIYQACRDGLLDIVQAYLDEGEINLNLDVDEDGFTALHHAARYDQEEVIKLLISHGAELDVKQTQDEIRPLHQACRYNKIRATVLLLYNRAQINIKDIKGRTPLHYATRKGHEDVIKVLISVSNCSVNEPDNDFTTPLIMASLQGNSDICETLISRGADIDRKDINEMTALMWASAEGHTNVAKVLLKAAQRHGPDNERRYIQLTDKEGNTALHLAVQNGILEVVNLLLAHGADVNCKKLNFATPLHLAATCGFLDIAKVLVYNRANVDSCDIEHMTPIHRAALYNQVDILEFLVKRGGNLNAKNKKNITPLHCACWKGQTKAASFLLCNGAQIKDVDIELKTSLHLAVQHGFYDTMQVLFKHGGKCLVGCVDKNDQTVLHYAASTGDVQILKALLDAGARPDARDQDERSPLHIAAQGDNVGCIEALIQASNHETNDDDLDGRTPLLLACLNGHSQAVQVLLSLGSDVSRRDDEHCTALMLAASEGHTIVMRYLLDNHASVNDVDKMRNTALHLACLKGHVDAVQLLLKQKGADVTLKNTYDYSPLDLAVDNLHHDVVATMLKNKRIFSVYLGIDGCLLVEYSFTKHGYQSNCQSCLSVRDPHGNTVLDRLIAKLPDTALIVLDHCVERTSRDDEEKSLTMSFDYQYIDPGPDDLSSSKNRYFALNTMVTHGRDVLLSHPLCQNLLSQKWVRFGRQMFYLNLFTYVGYLFCLTMFAWLEYPDLLDFEKGCPIYLNESLKGKDVKETDELLARREIVRQRGQTDKDKAHVPLYDTLSYSILLYVFIAVFFLRDVVKIISQKWRYVFNIYNIIVWILMATTMIFVTAGPDGQRCVTQWRAGWIAMFLAWINFIMYLRRIDFLGIYVIMFVTVLSSLVKLVLVFFMFCLAFTGSFYIVVQNVPSVTEDAMLDATTQETVNWDSGKRESTLIAPELHIFMQANKIFNDMSTLILNIIIMTLGEIDFREGFMSNDLKPFDADAKLLLLIFMFLMPIVLMNLMIGVAVGDIEKIQRNAYLKRIGLQVDLMYNIENNLPSFLQKKFHVKKATIKPNEGSSSIGQKILWRLLGSSRKVQFIEADSKDQWTSKLEGLLDKINNQQNSMKAFQLSLHQQSTILHEIATKLDIHVPAVVQNVPTGNVVSLIPPPHPEIVTTPSLPIPESGSSYDATGLSSGFDRRRQRSVRPTMYERPKSTII